MPAFAATWSVADQAPGADTERSQEDTPRAHFAEQAGCRPEAHVEADLVLAGRALIKGKLAAVRAAPLSIKEARDSPLMQQVV
jgi:hypothetical protein